MIDAVVSLALLSFWFWALVDVITTDASACRNLPKAMWVVIVLLIPGIGALVWVMIGRPPREPRAHSADSSVSRRPRGVEDAAHFSAPAPPMTDRRSAELDEQLERWEREQRERGSD
jgi:hypothetical protein